MYEYEERSDKTCKRKALGQKVSVPCRGKYVSKRWYVSVSLHYLVLLVPFIRCCLNVRLCPHRFTPIENGLRCCGDEVLFVTAEAKKVFSMG